MDERIKFEAFYEELGHLLDKHNMNLLSKSNDIVAQHKETLEECHIDLKLLGALAND